MSRPILIALLAACVSVAASATFSKGALAQSGNRDDCILDNCRDRPQRTSPRNSDRPYGRDRFNDERNNDRFGEQGPRRNDRGARRGGGGERYGAQPGQFDFYVLALSWSPSFCGSDAGRRSREQCAIGTRNAFVVHGLWPQFQRGFPSYCDDRNPPRAALDNARGVFPEMGLARYEWRKHGTCSGLAPSAYFDLTRRARDKVIVPEEFRAPARPVRKDPAEIARAFVEANRTLRPGMLAVTCVRGQLEEVRVCLSKDVRDFVPCPEVARAACRVGEITLPPPR